MKTCDEYQNLISGFLDETISPEEQSELLAHLSDCPQCKACFDDLLAIHETMAGDTVSAPAGFAQSVMANLPQQEKEEKSKVVSFPMVQRILAAAACLMLVLTGVWMSGGAKNNRASQKSMDAPPVRAATFSVGGEDVPAGSTVALTVLSLENEGFTGKNEDCDSGQSLILVLYCDDTQFPQGRPHKGDRALVTGVPGDAPDADSLRAFRVELQK